MSNFRIERDCLGEVEIPHGKLWGAQTQRSLHFFDIGDDHFPDDLIKAYALIKKACAIVNHNYGLLDDKTRNLIIQVCDEMLTGSLDSHFPLHVWMTGSGTQFNMNVNEVISNRICQLEGIPLGGKNFVHPNDHVNLSQSTNDNFPTAMYIVAAMGTKLRLIPEVEKLCKSIQKKAEEWKHIIKIGRTHLQDATPLTYGQELSGYAGLLEDNIKNLEHCLIGVSQLALGGTAVGTGINAPKGFGEATARELTRLTGLPFVSAPNKFTVQGSHDALVQLSGTFKTLANSLFKIANDIRFLSCGPRCGIGEIHLPENEPGSSIMPGKVNPTQCEALSMISIQVIANDLAVTLGGANGQLEMNVYKPLIIYNIMKSIRLLQDGCHSFRVHLIDGMTPNHKQIESHLSRSLMLVTALSPHIGYDKASLITHHAVKKDLSLKEAAIELGFVSEKEFDTWVNPQNMV